MNRSDQHKVVLAESIESVDDLNAKFYARFPYPWSATQFDYPLDPHFCTRMLNQDLGDWDHQTIGTHPQIWVAGCGTNQAIFTALRFPEAAVTGSDLSTESLKICSEAARQLNISNLSLQQESLNKVSYDGRFDYVICTGVIHHNADPKGTLERLATALKPNGILELMVYNRFHWIIPVAFQQGIRILTRDSGRSNIEYELSIAKRLIACLPRDTLLGSYVAQFEQYHESRLADNLIQPVMYSYTVESLEEMASSCGLELLTPCINQFDKVDGRLSWNLKLDDPVVQEAYDALPDTRRWQVANLFLMNQSPMLWFYLGRRDSTRKRKSERQICKAFLETKFEKAKSAHGSFVMGRDGQYKMLATQAQSLTVPSDPSSRKIYDSVDGSSPMREVFTRAGVDQSFYQVNHTRLKLTTPAFPCLISVGHTRSSEEQDEAVEVCARDLKPCEARESNRVVFGNIKPKPVRLSTEN
jgi:SAM-dependent methyltransferase